MKKGVRREGRVGEERKRERGRNERKGAKGERGREGEKRGREKGREEEEKKGRRLYRKSEAAFSGEQCPGF